MEMIHLDLGARILDPQDLTLVERIEATACSVWATCQMWYLTPWGLCKDPYCECKIALSEWEPLPLPGLGSLAEGGAGPWGLPRRSPRQEGRRDGL
jgi:hypothetical protein